LLYREQYLEHRTCTCQSTRQGHDAAKKFRPINPSPTSGSRPDACRAMLPVTQAKHGAKDESGIPGALVWHFFLLFAKQPRVLNAPVSNATPRGATPRHTKPSIINIMATAHGFFGPSQHYHSPYCPSAVESQSLCSLSFSCSP
jgi:hypothetical protein